MAVRLSQEAVQDGFAGSDQANSWAHGWVGYQAVTVAQTIPDSETDVTNLTVAPTLVAGRRYKITAKVRVSPNASPIIIFGSLYAAAVVLDSDQVRSATAGQIMRLDLLGVFDAVADGAVTFKVTGQSTTPGQTFDANGSASDKSVILVEDVGATT